MLGFHFVAGLSTGVLSASLLQPADLLKTRVQQSRSTSLIATLRDITSGPHAVRQLWRGTVPSMIRTGLGSALYFTSLNALRQHIARSSLLSSPALLAPTRLSSSALPKLSNSANLATGAFARASAGLVMMPVTVIKVRYESSFYAYRSLWEAGTAIVRTEGIRGLFSGIGATAIRDAPYAGLYVLFYEQMKKRFSSVPGSAVTGHVQMGTSQSASINFISGALAAGLATTITNPFDAVKTRLQLMPGKYRNTISAAKHMIHEEGFRSLFDGLGLRMARKAMSSALAWTLYEDLVRRAETRFLAEKRPFV